MERLHGSKLGASKHHVWLVLYCLRNEMVDLCWSMTLNRCYIVVLRPVWRVFRYILHQFWMFQRLILKFHSYSLCTMRIHWCSEHIKSSCQGECTHQCKPFFHGYYLPWPLVFVWLSCELCSHRIIFNQGNFLVWITVNLSNLSHFTWEEIFLCA